MSRRSSHLNRPHSYPNSSTPATVEEKILTPSTTPSDTSDPLPATRELDLGDRRSNAEMDAARDGAPDDSVQHKTVEASSPSKAELKSQTDNSQTPKAQIVRCKKHRHSKKSSNSRKAKVTCPAQASSAESSQSEDTTDESDDEQSSSTSSYSSSAAERAARKPRHRKVTRKYKSKRRKPDCIQEPETHSETSDSSSESSSSEDDRIRQGRRNGGKSRKRVHKSIDRESEDEEAEDEDSIDEAEDERVSVKQRLEEISSQLEALRLLNLRGRRGLQGRRSARTLKHKQTDRITEKLLDKTSSRKCKKKRSTKRASTLEFKRVDQVWDNSIHDYKLTESAEAQEDQFNEYIFTVLRKFDWDNHYKNTVIEIKSKVLKEALAEVMKDVKGVSLVEEEPTVDPNMLFLYLEELRDYTKLTLRTRRKSQKKRREKKRLALMRAHCKVLLSYLEEDYADTKKRLYPLLDAGNITFDLLWALFKPNTLAYTTTYGSVENPRCFKVDYANKESSFMRGEWYSIEGRYLEYDGKNFGLGDFESTVDSFKGARKITGLPCYPLKYHRDEEGVKKLLIERGRKFVALQGMNYRFHKGLAFVKKKKLVAKVNINGRVMLDPAIFRRVNPNYAISLIKPKDADDDDDSDSGECSECCGGASSDSEGAEGSKKTSDDKEVRMKTKFVRDKNDKLHVVQVEVENGQEVVVQNLDALPDRLFTEEELLIASSVILGFAFSEKLWLEFSLSGITEIEWNEGAFDSLVLPESQKTIVKALVESHKFHAAKTIDDVVQGKGKGLVAVLHGPPGTGKTLTAEGVAECIKCPLYTVSAGELGTDPGTLERELQKILDIAHSWGAVLLLDEADVFLEKREIHDIHRNALVSIFLRLLEYFQGILFLTTNRVETFDDAFQSRIHIALRYGELTVKAKKAVWKLFLEKVRAMDIKAGATGDDTFKERDLDDLANRQMNGRQIKNAVRTAQALAVNEKTKLTMDHIRKVLVVAESFAHDLKGGTGYLDVMRSYT